MSENLVYPVRFMKLYRFMSELRNVEVKTFQPIIFES